MQRKCEYCGDDEANLTLMMDRWVCDDCNRDDRDFDIEGYEERKRRRLAEEQEY